MEFEAVPVAQSVREYIAARPTIHSAMALGIVNHSALARQIAETEGLSKHDAVLKALTRLQAEIEQPVQSQPIQEALDGARLEIHTRVGMLTCKSSWQVLEALTRRAKAVVDDDERIHILHGWDALTAVANESVLEELQTAIPMEQVLAHETGLAELNVRTAESLDNIPGFIAHLASALAERGINVVDATTCRRDHIFLIYQDDLTDAVDALESRMN